MDSILNEFTAENGYIASQVMLEAYDITYGICDHDKDHRPMAIIAMHPEEDLSHTDTTNAMIRKYQMLGVRTEFGLSLIEFLSLPRERVQYIQELCVEAASKRNVSIEEVEEKLGR